MKVWNVIETTIYMYEGDCRSNVYVNTCISQDVAIKVRLDMEREYIENLYEDSDYNEKEIEEFVEDAQFNHEFTYADCETTIWEIEECEMCYE